MTDPHYLGYAGLLIRDIRWSVRQPHSQHKGRALRLFVAAS